MGILYQSCTLLINIEYFRPLEDGEASRGTVSDEDSMQGESSDALQRQEMSEARRAKLREIEVMLVLFLGYNRSEQIVF